MRSYRDWLTQSVGPHASRILYEPYARKRFGTAPDELTALLAWNTHASCQPDAWRVAAASQEQVWESGRQRIFEAGGEIIEGVNLQGFEVEDGRVVSLLTDHGREWIEACVFVDADSRTMLSWLPEALVDAPFRFDASRLPLLHRLEVTLPADVDALPWELHVVDEELPFWKLSKPGILPGRSQWLQHVTAHLTVHDKHPLWVADDATVAAAVKGALQAIAKVGSGPAVVQRWAQRVPTPSLRTQPCLGRILERYDKLGIVGIGAAGAYRQMRPTEQVQFVDTVLSSTPVKGSVMNQRETHRNLFEGQVLVPRRGSLRIGITD